MSVERLRGKLIVVEGIDQAGKQTVCEWLVEELGARDVPAVKTGFPDYTTPLGQEIGALMAGTRHFPPQASQLLYAANRWERAADIRGWLAEGQTVVVDRYIASGVAYGAAHGLEMAWMLEVERGLPTANLTLLLDITPEVSMARKTTARDAYETRLDLLGRAREAYLTLAREPGWHVVDANADRETVRQRVLAVLEHASADA